MKSNDVVELIKKFVQRDEGNYLPGSSKKMFAAPLVGFAEAGDPVFDEFAQQQVIGEHHKKPEDFLSGARTVISYFLPITEQICESNWKGEQASREWVFVRFYGELLNQRLRRFVSHQLESAGYKAAVPSLTSQFKSQDLSSNWSERHVAYACGLGTFGLHAGLITAEGVSGRFGSVVTTLNIASTDRDYHTPFAYCLHYSDDSCGHCLNRCPVDALSKEGKDKNLCRNNLRREGSESRGMLGFPYAPCGKCYVDVPCQRERPI